MSKGPILDGVNVESHCLITKNFYNNIFFMKKAFLVVLAIVIPVFMLRQCGGVPSSNLPTATTDQGWRNLEQVSILGYTGAAQDPQVTPDGKYLIFDSHNDAGEPSYLYWAKSTGYKTFQFMGKIDGVNLGKEQVRGNADRAGNFYFASTGYVAQHGGARIGHGVFKDGSVTNVAPITSIADPNLRPGYFLLDGMIKPDGTMLYYDVFQYTPGVGLQAHIRIARKNADGTFTKLPNSEDLMKNVNAVGTVYGAQPSDDGLSLYFTVGNLVPPGCKIFFVTRSSITEPFETPQLVKGVNDSYTYQGRSSPNCNEGGSLSPDGKHLYFHRVLDKGHSQIYVVTRP